jgi:hypothetical protein
MKTSHLLIAPLALAALAGCSNYGSSDNAAKPSRAPAAKVVGEPVDCVTIAGLRSTVRDDQTIDFESGSKTYRNTLPYSCSSLGFEKAFSYETSLSQLCSTDIIHVLRNTGGQLDRGSSCGLGKFVPIEYVK